MGSSVDAQGERKIDTRRLAVNPPEQKLSGVVAVVEAASLQQKLVSQLSPMTKAIKQKLSFLLIQSGSPNIGSLIYVSVSDPFACTSLASMRNGGKFKYSLIH